LRDENEKTAPAHATGKTLEILQRRINLNSQMMTEQSDHYRAGQRALLEIELEFLRGSQRGITTRFFSNHCFDCKKIEHIYNTISHESRRHPQRAFRESRILCHHEMSRKQKNALEIEPVSM
jgi:hypothetical protein